MGQNVRSGRPLSVAVLGTRGIPAAYGGFETFAEELSVRLVERGYRVTVYARRRFGERKSDIEYRGVQVRYVPTIYHKYAETPVHALMTFLALIRHRVDVALLCNAANAPFAWILRLIGIPLATNVDGIERMRSKWNQLGRWWYRLGEWASVRFSARVITDAFVIQRYYLCRHRASSEVIRYGVEPNRVSPGSTLQRFGLQAGQYLLYVSRLEPENNARLVIDAYREVPGEMPLVVVGDAPYASAYKQELRDAADGRVIFTGYQFGQAYRELRSHCYLSIQATEVGGTHPALVEAMGYGNAIIANGVPEHMEVSGGAALYYRRNDRDHLADLLRWAMAHPAELGKLGELAGVRARQRYGWDGVTSAYEAVIGELAQENSGVQGG